MNALLLIAAGALTSSQSPARLVGAVVSPEGPHRTIAAAVTATRPGGTVIVRAGVYREPTIVIDRPVTLVGEPGAILDGEGVRGLLVIAAPAVTVRQLTFRNTGTSIQEDRAALLVQETDRCTIEDNRFEATYFGIYLAKSARCVVTGNVLVGMPAGEVHTGNAIHAWGSRELEIRGNRVTGHRDGIYLEFTRHATVTANRSEANLRYGLHFMYADSSSYLGNRFEANGGGVAVMYSKAVRMRGNTFVRNRGASAYGLLLKEIADVELDGNRFLDNTTGLLADGADRVRVVGNEFDSNGWAIRMLASTSAGLVEGNLFRDNTFDVAVNARAVGARFAGNWWDRYRGWDLDRNGVGDVPFYPVRLFTVFVDRTESALMFHRSLFVRLLDNAERALPVLTPREAKDERPLIRPPSMRAVQ